MLLGSVTQELCGLGHYPFLVAAALDKFNDAGYDDYWYAVQLGGSYWEQSHYYKEERLEGEVPRIKEQSYFLDPGPEDQALPPDCTASRADFDIARKLLRRLEKEGWRNLSLDALEGDPFEANLLCLAHVNGQPLFCRTTPNSCGGDVWLWDQDGMFHHIGYTDDRMDAVVGDCQPILFQELNVVKLHLVTPETKRFFQPIVEDREALQRLCERLSEATLKISRITDDLIVLKAKNSRPTPQDRAGHWFRAEIYHNRTGYPLYKPKTEPVTLFKSGWNHGGPTDVAVECSAILGALEGYDTDHETDWRSDYSDAFGDPLSNGQMLALFVENGKAFLVRDHSVWEVVDSELEFVGLWGCPECHSPILPRPLPIDLHGAQQT